MMILAQNVPDISRVPSDFVQNWMIMAAFALVLIILVHNTWVTKKGQSREISGSIETRPGKTPADKGELDALKQSVEALSREISAQFNEAKRAGEARVAAITQNVDEEMGVLSGRIGSLADALHEKINKALQDNAGQASDIKHLQVEGYRHTQEIATIRSTIQDLLKAGHKPSKG
ncbi:MAG: hypothetical protein ACO1TE_29195 [Prosthecobacter sp.]